jgi:hypothetical protein
MKKTNNTNAIVFAQASDNTKAVVADRYVAHALYTQNKAIIESLDGMIVKGVGGFRAEFPTVKNAKEFIAKAITHIDAEDYAKARKTEPKAKAEAEPKKTSTPTKSKGKKTDDLVTVTLADGTQLQVKASALGIKTESKAPRKTKGNDKPTTAPNAKKASAKDEPKATKSETATPKKAKGNTAELTDAQKKALDKAKMSILNRAASAYSIANGGSATTFKALGKSEADLKDYIPNAKAGLLKSDKWAKAVAAHITEDMLGF